MPGAAWRRMLHGCPPGSRVPCRIAARRVALKGFASHSHSNLRACGCGDRAARGVPGSAASRDARPGRQTGFTRGHDGARRIRAGGWGGVGRVAAGAPGHVRPRARARRVRPGLHRAQHGQEKPRDHLPGPQDPRKPVASGCHGRRPAAGRRRGHPDPAPRRIPAPRVRQARHHAAGDRAIRRRHGVPAPGAGLADAARARWTRPPSSASST